MEYTDRYAIQYVIMQPDQCVITMDSLIIKYLPEFLPCRPECALLPLPGISKSYQHVVAISRAVTADRNSVNGILDSLRYHGQLILVVIGTCDSSEKASR